MWHQIVLKIINSLWPSETIWPQRPWSSLVQDEVMPNGPFWAKFYKIWIKLQSFSFQKCIWKCHLQNYSHVAHPLTSPFGHYGTVIIKDYFTYLVPSHYLNQCDEGFKHYVPCILISEAWRGHKDQSVHEACSAEFTDVFEWPLSACDLTMHGTSWLNSVMTWISWFWYFMKLKFASEVPKQVMAIHAL